MTIEASRIVHDLTEVPLCYAQHCNYRMDIFWDELTAAIVPSGRIFTTKEAKALANKIFPELAPKAINDYVSSWLYVWTHNANSDLKKVYHGKYSWAGVTYD